MVDDFLVESILPVREIHLIFGPSGAGKTTLLLQVLEDWSKGHEVFGYASKPVPFCYVACSRSNEELESHMRALSINPNQYPHFSMVDEFNSRERRTFANAYTMACHRVQGLQALFLDGLPTLCPGKVTDNAVVADFLSDIKRTCKQQNLTVVGVALASKARDGEGYSIIRDRISGAANWSEFTGFKALVDFTHPRNASDGTRTVVMLPQRSAGSVKTYAFDGPRLVEQFFADALYPAMDTWLSTLAVGTELSLSEIAERGESLGMAKRTAQRWIDGQLMLGTLTRAHRGLYVVPEPINPSYN